MGLEEQPTEGGWPPRPGVYGCQPAGRRQGEGPMAESVLAQMDRSLAVNLSSLLAGQFTSLVGVAMSIKAFVAALVVGSCITQAIQAERDLLQMLELLRRILALTLTQLVVGSLGPPQASRGAGGHAAEWSALQGLWVASLLVVAVCFLSRQAGRVSEAEEWTQVSSGVQWIFADSIGALLADPSSRRAFVVVGLVAMPLLVGYRGPLGQSVAMAWTNALVGMAVPGGMSTSNSGCELATILALACLLQALEDRLSGGLGTVQWYVHWRVSGIIVSALRERGAGELDTFIGSLAAMLVVQAMQAAGRGGGRVSGLRTLASIAATLVAASFPMAWARTLRGMGASGNVAASLVILVLVQLLARTLSRVGGGQP